MIHFSEKKVELNKGKVLVDFELDAFANLMIETELNEAAELEIIIGEVLSADKNSIERVYRCPSDNSNFQVINESNGTAYISYMYLHGGPQV